MDGCKKKSSKITYQKVGQHILSGFSASTILSFKDIKKNYDVFRGEDCIKKFFECLKKHVRRIVNFKNCKMKLLTNKLQESY